MIAHVAAATVVAYMCTRRQTLLHPALLPASLLQMSKQRMLPVLQLLLLRVLCMLLLLRQLHSLLLRSLLRALQHLRLLRFGSRACLVLLCS